jgi:hypothetical protein
MAAMDRVLADVLGWCATAFAVVAVMGALSVAVVEASDPHKGKISPAVVNLAVFGIILSLFGRILRYLHIG